MLAGVVQARHARVRVAYVAERTRRGIVLLGEAHAGTIEGVDGWVGRQAVISVATCSGAIADGEGPRWRALLEVIEVGGAGLADPAFPESIGDGGVQVASAEVSVFTEIRAVIFFV